MPGPRELCIFLSASEKQTREFVRSNTLDGTSALASQTIHVNVFISNHSMLSLVIRRQLGGLEAVGKGGHPLLLLEKATSTIWHPGAA
jgi:hypothetical protein